VIKIVRAKHLHDFVLEVEFADGMAGEYDLAPLFARDTVLTRPWADPEYFKRFMIELGALGWPNGLELSPKRFASGLRSRASCTAPRVSPDSEPGKATSRPVRTRSK
jgi:hypothetical protein